MGGGAYIRNTGNKTIYPGQKVYWDIPPDTQTALDIIACNPNARDAQKILPWTMPYDESIESLTAVTWRDTLGSALETYQAGELGSFNDGVLDPLYNPVGSFSGASAAGKVSSVMFDTCINLMLSMVDFMLAMGPFMDGVAEAAEYFVRRSGSNKPHIHALRQTIDKIQQSKNHVRDTVVARNNIRAMLMQDAEAAEIFSHVLVPEGHPDYLLYQMPIGARLRDMSISDPMRVFFGMQNDSLENVLRLGRRVPEWYTRRIFCTALSRAEPGQFFDGTINAPIA
jgi:hypothetical protein